ncbi:hypothetical protein AVEN_221328-1 [Araneus ventricosus]|uniref:Uncharacterized protein n=1 Tax=Araneus ventricosus TaxID=182803 RepID=A0A4Y2B0Z8_ARAVE|nr:hypothetical protein AVEN_221328-1 [Araneus ventricosus]
MLSFDASFIFNLDAIDKFVHTSIFPPEKRLIELTETISNSENQVYMDGPRIKSEIGFTACIFKNNEPFQDFLFRLKPYNSVFQAELAAIDFAAG